LHGEKRVERNWLLCLDGAFCCDRVRSTAGPIFEYTHASGPEFLDPSSRRIANAGGYACLKATSAKPG
jgi:hypothetical protein